jgi:hypothetical protein
MKPAHKKTLRITTITIIVLLVFTIGAGLAYTWIMGKTQPARVVDVTPTAAPTIKHVTPSQNVPESASIQSLTTPIAPGENASVTIRTNPASTCRISVIYDKTASTDSGLSPKIPDEFGSITWSWTVEIGAPVGKWPVKVTCDRGKLSAVVIGDLVVSKL